jgi:hypothetical protein
VTPAAKVQVTDVISSTIHKATAVAASDSARQSAGVATSAAPFCSLATFNLEAMNPIVPVELSWSVLLWLDFACLATFLLALALLKTKTRLPVAYIYRLPLPHGSEAP